MTSPRQILRESGLRPVKSLGQNFLVHTEAADKIVSWAGVQPGETILEIGPGLGQLTEGLWRAGARVIAVERDPKLIPVLTPKWQNPEKGSLHREDFLETDLPNLLRSEKTKVRCISNLPYTLSTPIIERLLDHRHLFSDWVLLLQEEVVDRLTASVSTREWGRLSIWVQLICDLTRGPRISRGNFFPVPDVESRLVRMVPRSSSRVPEAELPEVLRVVAFLFQHRRKTVRNSLRDSGFELTQINNALIQGKIDGGRRPETLSIDELAILARNLRE